MEQEQNTVLSQEEVEQTPTPSPEKGAPKKKLLPIIIIVIIILGVGAYVYTNQLNKGEVVAVVNGEKLYKAEVDENTQRIIQIAELQGQPAESEEALAAIANMSLGIMIDNMILIDAAEEAGYSVSNDEIEARYQEEVSLYESEAVFEEQLATINLTVKELRENMHDELLVKKYFDAAIEEANLGVTQEEIKVRYDAYVEANASNAEVEIQTLEVLQNDIEEVLAVEKERIFIEGLVEQLKEEAEVEKI